MMPQIDLTSTLSLLLGIPIPYGNIGKINYELWNLKNLTLHEFEEALSVNAWQVN